MESPSRFISGMDEHHLFGLESDSLSFDTQDAILQELDLLLEEVDDQERTEAFPAVTAQHHPIHDLPQTEQQPIAPPAKFRKRKVPTLHEDNWAPYKDRIVELHILENRALKEVREIMKEELDSVQCMFPASSK
jgi:hypothetical protein